MRRPFLLLVLIFLSAQLTAQVQSPEAFLGYKIGTRYTPHWRIVEYFKYVAQQAPQSVKLEQYGWTNEKRPLMLSYISSAQNIQNLETIRQNNLRLANMETGGGTATEAGPVVVWLSYNVHGNETSSSEASMLTLYALVDPANSQTKEWLKNTVVIIDPCLNPDGRDRYVNWFNSMAGMQYNPDPQSREHVEPWPGGRTNHYNFDLNRDWAWQSQVESQQRLKKFNQWLPQVHVDFHEQGPNSPYYFAPAAEPYHEVITPWQREFQVMIGRNNAKYFDKNGWLYFTKDGFDLFYPGYGDTYPIYSGAIGMTFEQGGGPAGGLGITTNDGDTLTLTDRALHHYTTGLSTVEVASQNAPRLIREFHRFYTDALQSGSGDYKTYVIKRRSTPVDLESTLDRYLSGNGITWAYAGKTASYRGLSYITGKEETFNVEPHDILLSTYQPKSVLLRVLFEPSSKQAVPENMPYDITAWSLPYAFGLDAYAVKDRIAAGSQKEEAPSFDSTINKIKNGSAYAYVLPWKSFSSAKVLARLLKAGIRVRYSNEPFTANGKNFDPGSLIVTQASNRQFAGRLPSMIMDAAYKEDDFHYNVEAVSSGFVDKGHDIGSSAVALVQKPKVVLITGEGTVSGSAGAIWHLFEQQLQYPVTLINANDITRMNLGQYNVIIMPDGFNYRFLNDRAFNDQLKTWVRQGGKLIALQGAVAQLAETGWGLHNKADSSESRKRSDSSYSQVRAYQNRTIERLGSYNSGTIYKVQLDNTHPLGYGYPNYYFTLKEDESVYEFIKEGGWNVGVLKKNNYISGFVGSKAREKLKDGLVFGVQDVGRGRVVYLSDDVLFRSFWETGKLLFCNAVFMVGQ